MNASSKIPLPKKCHSIVILAILITCNSLVAPVFGQGGSNGTATRRLKIVIPVSTYKEFVSITKDPVTGEQTYGGFSIEVFKAVVNTALTDPIVYDFVPFAKPDGSFNGSFDKMLQAVFDKEYDGAVGDTTLRFYRTRWVDFTYPYTETGITMMLPTNRNLNNRQVTRIKVIPLIKGLVSATLGFCFISALLFWFVEYKNHKNNNKTIISSPQADDTPPDIYPRDDSYWHRETLKAIVHTRLVMVMWFLVLMFLSACYAASLSSLLTAQQQKMPVRTLNELIRTRANVGIQTGAFTFNALKERGFLENETPYLKVFLSKQCNNDYTLVPSVNLPAGGFGFAFQKGSGLAAEVSNGILKVLDSGQITTIQSQTVGDSEKQCSPDDMSASSDSSMLDTDTLWILFAGAIGVAILVIILYFVYLGTQWDAFRKRLAFPCYMLPG
ncbi:glutamate receptor 2.5-like [Silene latifolia]|uniref:glutamate receptor 2.5-like n=1 Tax=Silene latifolia TaxID=37657 RepID=UPI003D77582B